MARSQVIAEPGVQEVVITRRFDAPRDRVFRTFTDPEKLPRWWGPRYLTTTVDRMDVRPGGGWRFIQRAPDGAEHAFRGVYHDVVAGERMVGTFEYEGMPGHVCLETATFEDDGAGTRLTLSSVFQTLEDRDGMIQSGMESGMQESHERLDELLAEQAVATEV